VKTDFLIVLAKFAVTALGVGFATLLWVWMVGLDAGQEARTYPREEIEGVRRSRDALMESDTQPTFYRQVDYSKISGARWEPKGESPILTELVRDGRLPTVRERTGEEPAVLEGIDGIGRYGGTWNLATTAQTYAWEEMNRHYGAQTLVRWSPLGYPIVPHVARDWEVSDDSSTWIFHLRKGMKWSDGHPFTAHDIHYWWWFEFVFGLETGTRMEENGDKVIRHGDTYGRVTVIDDQTVEFAFDAPNPFFLEKLAGTNLTSICFPKHYLKKYHPEFGDQELIENAMQRRGYVSKSQLYMEMKQEDNPLCPRLTPWINQTYKPNPPYSFVRNPYFWAVDTEGNQLPYVDQVTMEVQPPELITIDTAAGGYPATFNRLEFSDYSLFMKGRKTYGYDVLHWYPAVRSNWTIWPNLNRRTDPGDEIGRMKSELLNTKEFIQALSLAINREAIIRAEFNGIGEPAQLSPGRESPFSSERLHNSFVEYDPGRAERLLDEIGLTNRDREDYRTFGNGDRMLWFVTMANTTDPGPVQFVLDDWKRVGIRALPKIQSSGLALIEFITRKQDFLIGGDMSGFIPVIDPKSYAPVGGGTAFATAYGTWYEFKISESRTSDRVAYPPPPGHPLGRAQIPYQAAMQAPNREAGQELFQEVLNIAAENLWSIAITTPPPQIAVIRNDFKNVPRKAIYGSVFRTPANLASETFYFEDHKASRGNLEAIRKEIATITPPPDSVEATEGSLDNRFALVGRLIKLLFAGIALAAIVLVGAKHPYVGRRLLLFVPMLLVISMIAFVIIQLPPGNVIETRLMNLEESTSPANAQEIEQIREYFHLDDPFLVQYARWMGFTWFFSFEEADKGLVQGDLGVSLDDPRRPQPVNRIVGDRIVLTFLISLGTVLFTWALALPIGIYSAVKQYSLGDYTLTLISFIGMSVPGFLLALLLIYWGGVFFDVNLTGLFSPQYEAQPEWTWGKIKDLLAHIWIPLIVLGFGGTASMIRVMRGNLLDELEKPYVTTARAKGVRPARLLLKYPVRIAINPFVSTIGSLFPGLVSGGAIVAVVLGLPTVGPLLLRSLLAEDIYLAGSMLVVLSLLGIAGTLVSDLMLMGLDPRIRMEGGNR
jgi:ABC-type dipeptide/oligopeptide/nickel transport system permease component/ABC-type transport system substrate-binding protein